MWDLIVSVPDHCLSFYFDINELVLKKSQLSNYPFITDCFLKKNERWIFCQTIILKSTNGVFPAETQSDQSISRWSIPHLHSIVPVTQNVLCLVLENKIEKSGQCYTLRYSL